MVRYAVDLPVDAIEAQIGNAFDVIIHVCRDEGGRRFLTAIADVMFDKDSRSCEVKRVYERKDFDQEGRWLGSDKAEGIPDDLGDRSGKAVS